MKREDVREPSGALGHYMRSRHRVGCNSGYGIRFRTCR